MNQSNLFRRPLNRAFLDIVDTDPAMVMLGLVNVRVDTRPGQLLGDVDARPVNAELVAVLDE